MINGYPFKLENIQQHALVALRNQVAGVGYQGAQFVTGDGKFRVLGRVDANELQQTIGNDIDEPHNWIEHCQQRFENERGGEGNFFRVEGGDGFWSNFCKYQQHQGQQEGANGDACVAPETHGDNSDNGRRQHIDQVVAD